jgi:zinc/manganese transport system ATP-binding protein
MKIIINKAPRAVDAIAVTDVDFAYPRSEVFRGLTLSIPTGAVTAVVGSNGSGKSTLLGLLAGVLPPRRGEVCVNSGDIAFAVQRSAVTDTFPVTAAEAVMMGRWRRLGLLRRATRTDREIVTHWLRELGLSDLRHRTLGELSGGQRQRVLLAQALAQQAPLLLLDEPTTGLDTATGARVIATLHQLAESGTTVVVATHDPRMVEAAGHCIDLDRWSAH